MACPLVDASHGQYDLKRVNAFPMAHRLFPGDLSLAPQAPNAFVVHSPIATAAIPTPLVAVWMCPTGARWLGISAHQQCTSRCLGLVPACLPEVSKVIFGTHTRLSAFLSLDDPKMFFVTSVEARASGAVHGLDDQWNLSTKAFGTWVRIMCYSVDPRTLIY